MTFRPCWEINNVASSVWKIIGNGTEIVTGKIVGSVASVLCLLSAVSCGGDRDDADADLRNVTLADAYVGETLAFDRGDDPGTSRNAVQLFLGSAAR